MRQEVVHTLLSHHLKLVLCVRRSGCVKSIDLVLQFVNNPDSVSIA